MKVYSFSEARQNFAAVLDNAHKEGVVRIMRRDGRAFAVQTVRDGLSPLAVQAVPLDVSRDEIASAVRAGRERETTRRPPAIPGSPLPRSNLLRHPR